MKSTNSKKSRKEFLNNFFKGSFFAALLLTPPISKILGIMKSPKIYFKENPESVKRQK